MIYYQKVKKGLIKMSEKTQGEELREKLFNNKKNGWESVSEEEGRNIFNYCDGYMKFLNEAKTEREIVKRATEIAKENGYKRNFRIQYSKSRR